MYRPALQTGIAGSSLPFPVNFDGSQINVFDLLSTGTFDHLSPPGAAAAVYIPGISAAAQVNMAELILKVPVQALQVRHADHVAVPVVAVAGRIGARWVVARQAIGNQTVGAVGGIILVGVTVAASP